MHRRIFNHRKEITDLYISRCTYARTVVFGNTYRNIPCYSNTKCIFFIKNPHDNNSLDTFGGPALEFEDTVTDVLLRERASIFTSQVNRCLATNQCSFVVKEPKGNYSFVLDIGDQVSIEKLVHYDENIVAVPFNTFSYPVRDIENQCYHIRNSAKSTIEFIVNSMKSDIGFGLR